MYIWEPSKDKFKLFISFFFTLSWPHLVKQKFVRNLVGNIANFFLPLLVQPCRKIVFDFINSNDSDILSEPKPTTQEIISLLNKKLRHRKLLLYL